MAVGNNHYLKWIFGVLFLLFFSCQNPEKETSRPIATVSILPQKFLIEQIAGDKFEVEVLIPPGASPVTYEPLPKQLTQLKKSNVYFQIGHLVFEQAWTNKIKNVNPKLNIVNLSENLILFEDDHGHGEEEHGNVNPHIWMSPLYMRSMAEKVSEVLTELKPESGSFFAANLKDFQKTIDSLHLELKTAFENSPNKSFLIYHPALTYFANDYGLYEYSLENEGKEPSPKEFAELIDVAKRESIKRILVQNQFDKSNATSLAKEISAEIVSIDPLSENWLEEIVNLKKILTQE